MEDPEKNIVFLLTKIRHLEKNLEVAETSIAEKEEREAKSPLQLSVQNFVVYEKQGKELPAFIKLQRENSGLKSQIGSLYEETIEAEAKADKRRLDSLVQKDIDQLQRHTVGLREAVKKEKDETEKALGDLRAFMNPKSAVQEHQMQEVPKQRQGGPSLPILGRRELEVIPIDSQEESVKKVFVHSGTGGKSSPKAISSVKLEQAQEAKPGVDPALVFFDKMFKKQSVKTTTN